MVRLTDRPDMTLDVYRGRKTNNTITVDVKANKQQKQQLQNNNSFIVVTVFYHRITRPTLTVTLHYPAELFIKLRSLILKLGFSRLLLSKSN